MRWLPFFLFMFMNVMISSTVLQASRACSVGLTRDQRIYMRDCLACFDDQADITYADACALDNGFFKDALLGLMGENQSIAVDALHSMLKYQK